MFVLSDKSCPDKSASDLVGYRESKNGICT